MWGRRRQPKIEKLRSKDDLRGLQAALAYSDQIVDRMGNLIDRGAPVRADAVRGLTELEVERRTRPELPPSEVVLWLAGALGDDSEQVGVAAAEGLGQLGGPSAVDHLVDFLAVRGPAAPAPIRSAALNALAASKKSGITEQWCRKVVDTRDGELDDVDRQDLAVIMGADAAPDPERRLFVTLVPRLEPDVPGLSVPRPAEAILAWCMPADMDELAPVLRGADVPEAAVRLAGLSGNQGLLEPLVSLLEHPSKTVRREAVAALGALCDTAAVMPLLMATTDPDVIVRRKAVSALDILGSAGVTAAMAVLANTGAPQEIEQPEPQPAIAGEKWVRTLERLAERTGLVGKAQRRWGVEHTDRYARLAGVRTRYQALMAATEPTEGPPPIDSSGPEG